MGKLKHFSVSRAELLFGTGNTQALSNCPLEQDMSQSICDTCRHATSISWKQCLGASAASPSHLRETSAVVHSTSSLTPDIGRGWQSPYETPVAHYLCFSGASASVHWHKYTGGAYTCFPVVIRAILCRVERLLRVLAMSDAERLRRPLVPQMIAIAHKISDAMITSGGSVAHVVLISVTRSARCIQSSWLLPRFFTLTDNLWEPRYGPHQVLSPRKRRADE
ncbi:hypothetical protein GLOTRDRAFT_96457 [Gloeophyllum trabeum ATCC 11539]|uniref:Uncharacterized protein n=1 Tax=Gloeophyllum trabeum (strain ATCC 11539 / FP-39264 / Madison 617) TaxID=670483 RepID=S7RAI3_GLOTA|nr:uncharacterized protein GLOTRDRAFT_96457 [Gloeophyllum trabeum ATCC 11539]EPQ51265.1 hypothetical protein GLOTRDRAFT_96457 [Gloeophyllum trabeum ATCC 11539]